MSASSRLTSLLRNTGVVLIAVFSTWSCASTIDAPPLEPESASGVTFWVLSPVDRRIEYSFHWNDETLSAASDSGSGSETYDLPIGSCPLLAAYLIQFRESVLESVKIVFVREPAIPVTGDVTDDGRRYRVRYTTDRFSTFVQLEGYDGGEVPWIAAARKVRERAAACVAN